MGYIEVPFNAIPTIAYASLEMRVVECLVGSTGNGCKQIINAQGAEILIYSNEEDRSWEEHHINKGKTNDQGRLLFSNLEPGYLFLRVRYNENEMSRDILLLPSSLEYELIFFER